MINAEQLFSEKFSKSDYLWTETPVMNWDLLKDIPENEREDAILNYALERLIWVGQGSIPNIQTLKTKKAELEQSLMANNTNEDQYSAWVANGFDTGLGYKLRVADSDQSKYANLVTGNLLENTPDSQVFDIEALDDTKVKLTWGELKPILVAYKNYCYASWKASKGIS